MPMHYKEQLTRTVRIGDRLVTVFDGLFDEDRIQNFRNVIGHLDFQRRESFDRELNVAIERDLFLKAPFLSPVTEAMLEHDGETHFGIAPNSVCLSHAYAAAIGPGSCGTLHHDNADPNSITFLYYANAVWRTQWGGETLFYDDAGDAVVAVTPKPGRLVAFHSNLQHRAGVPHPDTPTYRYTVSAFYYPPKVPENAA